MWPKRRSSAKASKLEDAKAALVALAAAEPATTARAFPRMFTLPFDEQKGLQISDDEELGILCAEIVAAASRGHHPEIAIEITTQPWVSAKLDKLDAKQTLSIAERKERVTLDEIDRRYERKKVDIANAVLLTLAHPRVGQAYFGGQGDATQGRRSGGSLTPLPSTKPGAQLAQGRCLPVARAAGASDPCLSRRARKACPC